MNKQVRYYAFAFDGKDIRQILITRKNGKMNSSKYTDKTYNTVTEAENDMRVLNCGG